MCPRVSCQRRPDLPPTLFPLWCTITPTNHITTFQLRSVLQPITLLADADLRRLDEEIARLDRDKDGFLSVSDLLGARRSAPKVFAFLALRNFTVARTVEDEGTTDEARLRKAAVRLKSHEWKEVCDMLLGTRRRRMSRSELRHLVVSAMTQFASRGARLSTPRPGTVRWCHKRGHEDNVQQGWRLDAFN